jgi:hypothetical protein
MTSLHKRLTGAASIAAGVMIASGGMIHILFHNPFGHWVLYFGYVVLVFALAGLYAVQARESGALGLAGWVLATLGAMLVSISAYLMLADVAGFEQGHEAWMFMYFDLGLYLPGIYALLLGLALFGLATAYARVLPRYAGVLLALSGIADMPAEMVMALGFLYYVATALLLASLVWMGLALLAPKQAARPAQVQAPVGGGL